MNIKSNGCAAQVNFLGEKLPSLPLQKFSDFTACERARAVRDPVRRAPRIAARTYPKM